MASSLTRARIFEAVQLESRLPQDYVDQFEALGVPSALICHDCDPDTNPHVHFWMYFSGKKTVDQVLRLLPVSFQIDFVKVKDSKDGSLSYLLHWSNNARKENKHPYDASDLQIFNGLKVDFAKLIPVDGYTFLDFCIKFNEEQGCFPLSVTQVILLTRSQNPALSSWLQTHYRLAFSMLGDLNSGAA